MRIGIFGGSFDPVHLEHVHLCERAKESLRLDRLIVVPAKIPPHKQGKTLSSDADRIELCKLAFSSLPYVEVSDWEILADGVSYSYLTCRHFKKLYPTAELYFLVGEDMLASFATWKNPEDILKNARLAVCARESSVERLEGRKAEFFARFQTDFEIIDYVGGAVSSTAIRVLAAAGEEISPYVGEKVARRIEEKGLYKIDGAKEALSLEKAERKAHSLRVALFAARRAQTYGIDERKAITASLFHDCAKNLPLSSPYLKGFLSPENVPEPVLHEFTGAFVAENTFGIKDEDILNAIRYHTSGRKNMSDLEKLVYLSDMLEDGRTYAEAAELRKILERDGLDLGLKAALEKSLAFLKEKKTKPYSLTEEAYGYICKNTEKKKGESYGGNDE